jgi:hypothetical protein
MHDATGIVLHAIASSRDHRKASNSCGFAQSRRTRTRSMTQIVILRLAMRRHDKKFSPIAARAIAAPRVARSIAMRFFRRVSTIDRAIARHRAPAQSDVQRVTRATPERRRRCHAHAAIAFESSRRMIARTNFLRDPEIAASPPISRLAGKWMLLDGLGRFRRLRPMSSRPCKPPDADTSDQRTMGACFSKDRELAMRVVHRMMRCNAMERRRSMNSCRCIATSW